MSVKLTDVFSSGELLVAQVAMARASAGCSTFFHADAPARVTCAAPQVGRRVSLCCFSEELSLQCAQAAHDQARVAGGHISDTHKCKCGAFYYWVGLRLQETTTGYCQVRAADAMPPSSSHLVASYLRTLNLIGNIRAARQRAQARSGDTFASMDPHQLYGHPGFLALIRMIGEAGRALLHSSRCLYLSYDSAHQMVSGEYATELSQEQLFALQFSIRQFPIAAKALETMQFEVGDKQCVPADLAVRLRPILNDGRFVVLPMWVMGHVLGFLVFGDVKAQPEQVAQPLSIPDLGKAGSDLLAVLGHRLELFGTEDDEPAEVGVIQRYAAMGQMAAEIGHDIQASLYGMKNYAYLLAKGVTDPRKLTYTRAITEGISYIEKLSAEMRKLSGEPRTVTLAPTDLCKVIDSAVLLMNPLAIERTITITKKFADDIPILQADPNALTEVFLNLGINAIHSMSDGGEISITVKPEGDRVAVTFQDNGSGITREILEKFWNNSSYAAKSFTNKGLYIVQRIIRQLNGKIELDTTPGAGTTFFIVLWVNPAAIASKGGATRPAPTSVPASPSGQAKTALT